MWRRLSQGVVGYFAKSSSKNTEKVEIVLRTALVKTRKNIALGRESHPLTSAENKFLYRNSPFKMIHWIDPDKILHSLYWPEKRGQLIVYDGIGRLDLFSQHSTSVFIRELIVQKKRLEETTLYNSKRAWVRPVILGGKRVKIPLNTHENMVVYFDKCRSLIKSIQERGVEGFVEKNQNIGLAVTSEGGIAHFRCGHHRLAIAQALGIKSIPIDILLVSAKFLVERVPRWRLRSSLAMVRAVDEVLRDTVANFSKR